MVCRCQRNLKSGECKDDMSEVYRFPEVLPKLRWGPVSSTRLQRSRENFFLTLEVDREGKTEGELRGETEKGRVSPR